MRSQSYSFHLMNIRFFILIFIVIPISNTNAYPSAKIINIEKVRNLNDAPLNYIKDKIKTDKIAQIEYDLLKRCCVEYEGNPKTKVKELTGNKIHHYNHNIISSILKSKIKLLLLY